MIITLICPECKEEKKVELTQEEYENYTRYKYGEGLIQDMLPNVDRKTRELLRGDMCGDCWEIFFGTPPWEEDEFDDEDYEEEENQEE